MLTYFKHVLAALLWDESAFRRWMFGLFGFAVTLASMVFIDGVEVAFTWSHKQWAAKVLTALVALAFAMVNPTLKLPKKGALVELEPPK